MLIIKRTTGYTTRLSLMRFSLYEHIINELRNMERSYIIYSFTSSKASFSNKYMVELFISPSMRYVMSTVYHSDSLTRSTFNKCNVESFFSKRRDTIPKIYIEEKELI